MHAEPPTARFQVESLPRRPGDRSRSAMPGPRIYHLLRPDLAWVDYGDVLAHGFARLNEDRTVLELQRTGPFVPPFSQPSYDYVVLTHEMLETLRTSGLTGFTVMPVVITKSPKIDWRTLKPCGESR